MSQTATPAAAPPPPATAPAPAASAPVAAPQPGTSYIDTPALLNRWQLIGMSVAIVFGIVSALVQFVGWQSDGRAADDTEQLVRVQEIQSSLLRADALSTNAFLVAGLEDPAQRQEYDDAIDTVLRDIANAAEAQPADRKALAALNEQVDTYATYIAQARANNRQGFPVGAGYQTAASDQLRNAAIPVLDALVEANTDRADGAMGGQHPIWLGIVGLAALAGLWWLNRELARAFRRRLNKGLVVAAAIVAVVTLVTTAGAWIRDSSNDALRDGEFQDAVSSAVARTAANDAKANESLRLIKRGSGADNEKKWGELAAVVEKKAPATDLESWSTYTERHAQIVKADDSNRWSDAVDIATTDDEKTGSTAPFNRFDASLADDITKASGAAIDDLRSGRVIALMLSALTLLLGVAAALAVARGIGQRRREFS
ncbi:hypothetical protein [Nocardioides daeguensis]|uniref:Chemotaxis methyl-accepting receptor HlyB-like 4HB MCP domain-containing protein n=1 Tax=Nocardioides daeguensis TaxID=908359 RepID=A0ABP6WGH1_9ACTN|nr:hypothetical protein [Nocardioides daeguensis]MBV6729138.1 hypothetical protein [Nocardioides daeguensis]MCR1774858.1 hypothetical protein [Nocardioides daeguensis]